MNEYISKKQPKQPKVIFAGKIGCLLNVKYAFLQALSADYGFSPVLAVASEDDYKILQTAGLPVITRCTAHDVADAAAFVLDDFVDNTALGHLPLPPVPTIQLWHGVPLKKIGFPEIHSAVNMTPEKAARLVRQYSGYTSVPSTSSWVTEQLFSQAFKAHNFPELGFARNDVLLRNLTRNDMLGVDTNIFVHLKRHRKAGGRIVVYMPTFRDTGGSFFQDEVLDLHFINAFCMRYKIIFLAKFHHLVRMDSYHGMQGFMLYNSMNDIYPLLHLADALITDYSSIYFDFMLLNKPIIFFPYDKEKYISRDRELFFDYSSITPGIHAHSQDELASAILRTIVHLEDRYMNDRILLRNAVFAKIDSLSAHRTCLHIRELINATLES